MVKSLWLWLRYSANRNDAGQFDIRSALVLAGAIIGAVVGAQVIAALAPTWFAAVADLAGTFDNTTTNDSTADSLLPIFRLLVALAGVFAIVGAALLVARFRSK
jgi:hypothetical protein